MPPGGPQPPYGPVPAQQQPKKPKRFGWAALIITAAETTRDEKAAILKSSVKLPGEAVANRELLRGPRWIHGRCFYSDINSKY
jgi:hypothetical protein